MKPNELNELPFGIKGCTQIPEGRGYRMKGTKHGTKHVRIAAFLGL